MCTTHPWVKKQVDMLVEKSLILLVACTEILQELVSQFHDILHSDIFTLLDIFVITQSDHITLMGKCQCVK